MIYKDGDLDEVMDNLKEYLSWYIEKSCSYLRTTNFSYLKYNNTSDFKYKRHMLNCQISKFNYPFKSSKFKIQKLDGEYTFKHHNFISYDFKKVE